MFSRAWYWCHVFPRLTQVTWFPALSAGWRFLLRVFIWLTFSRFLQLLRAYSRPPRPQVFALSSGSLCLFPKQSFLRCLPASDDVNTRRALCPRYTAHSPNSHWVSVQPCMWLQWRTSRALAGAEDIHRWPHPKRARHHLQHRWLLGGCWSTTRKFKFSK